MPSTSVNGKLCYVEIPALDVARSAAFYQDVFGWKVRQRGDGQTAFDDTTGEVSGAWVTGRPASADPASCSTSWSTMPLRPLARSPVRGARSCSRSARTHPR
jgi:predicted enzyme related to lactoylglutathione lyase